LGAGDGAVGLECAVNDALGEAAGRKVFIVAVGPMAPNIGQHDGTTPRPVIGAFPAAGDTVVRLVFVFFFGVVFFFRYHQRSFIGAVMHGTGLVAVSIPDQGVNLEGVVGVLGGQFPNLQEGLAPERHGPSGRGNAGVGIIFLMVCCVHAESDRIVVPLLGVVRVRAFGRPGVVVGIKLEFRQPINLVRQFSVLA